MGQHFSSKVEQLWTSYFCNLWDRVVVQESNASVIRTLLSDFGRQSIQLLTVQNCGEGCVVWEQIVMNDTFAIPSNANHNLQQVETCLWFCSGCSPLLTHYRLRLILTRRHCFLSCDNWALASYSCAFTRAVGHLLTSLSRSVKSLAAYTLCSMLWAEGGAGLRPHFIAARGTAPQRQ